MNVTPRDLLIALEESVKLQSHYATLLNMHDGGERITFTDAEAWLTRLRETGTLPSVPRGTSQTSAKSQKGSQT
jgi:hypothetical protein